MMVPVYRHKDGQNHWREIQKSVFKVDSDDKTEIQAMLQSTRDDNKILADFMKNMTIGRALGKQKIKEKILGIKSSGRQSSNGDLINKRKPLVKFAIDRISTSSEEERTSSMTSCQRYNMMIEEKKEQTLSKPGSIGSLQPSALRKAESDLNESVKSHSLTVRSNR